MHTAAVIYSLPRGYQVELTEIPLRWLVASAAGELVLDATGHILCCNMPDWLHNIRWGPADADGWTERSLGHQMYRAGQWLTCGITFRHEKRIAVIDVTPEWVGEHFPDFLAEMAGLEHGSDAMSVTFS